MKSILILQTMSLTAAVVLTIALLLVAGLIGYLSAWFYAKSVYTPIIKKLEDEKVQLNREIAGLKDDIKRQKGTIEDLTKKVDELDRDIAEREKQISEKVDIITGLENEMRELRKQVKV